MCASRPVKPTPKPTPPASKGCSQLIGTVTSLLNARVGGLVSRLGFHARKKLLGVALSAKAALRLTFTGAAQGSEINLNPRVADAARRLLRCV